MKTLLSESVCGANLECFLCIARAFRAFEILVCSGPRVDWTAFLLYLVKAPFVLFCPEFFRFFFVLLYEKGGMIIARFRRLCRRLQERDQNVLL